MAFLGYPSACEPMDVAFRLLKRQSAYSLFGGELVQQGGEGAGEVAAGVTLEADGIEGGEGNAGAGRRGF